MTAQRFVARWICCDGQEEGDIGAYSTADAAIEAAQAYQAADLRRLQERATRDGLGYDMTPITVYVMDAERANTPVWASGQERGGR